MEDFLSIDEVYEILNRIWEGIPENILAGLNGGIILEEDIKYHPESEEGHPLYILGEYVSGPLGRMIKIYYGSLRASYSYKTSKFIERKLEEVLFHELTHHLESLAGEEDLRIEDFINMENYRRSKEGRN